MVSDPQAGDLANSYRLISVVSHIGSSSSSGALLFLLLPVLTAVPLLKPGSVLIPGHYISDVYDMKKQSWLTYNDLDVSRTQEAAVQRDRDRSGYIFFYMHKWVIQSVAPQVCPVGEERVSGRPFVKKQLSAYRIKKNLFLFLGCDDEKVCFN